MLGDLGLPPMSEFGVRSPGHEGAGVIVAKGANVKQLRIGQRAGLKPVFNTCQMCDLCWDDKEVYCPQSQFTGLVVPGTYQQYIVSPEKYTSPIPDGVSDFIAGPIMCSAGTMLRAIRESGLQAGAWACFPGGGGGVGIQGVQIAKYLGMRPVVIDTGAEKKELAMKMGAEAFVDFKEVKDVGEEVVKVCDGIGAHGVIVTAPSAYKTALSVLGTRVAGIVMCVGLREYLAHPTTIDSRLTMSSTPGNGESLVRSHSLCAQEHLSERLACIIHEGRERCSGSG